MPLESLFLFATKKEVIKNITENLSREKDADDWKIVKTIQKTRIPEDLIIPKYEEVIADIPAYSINKTEYDELINFVGSESGSQDKLVFKCQLIPIQWSVSIFLFSLSLGQFHKRNGCKIIYGTKIFLEKI